MKKLTQTLYRTMVCETIVQNGIEKMISFQTCLILCFDFHQQKGNIFVKTVYGIRKCNKIPPELFQINLSYLIFIKIFIIIRNYFSR